MCPGCPGQRAEGSWIKQTVKQKGKEKSHLFLGHLYTCPPSFCRADPLTFRLIEGVVARRKATAVLGVGSYSGSESQRDIENDSQSDSGSGGVVGRSKQK